MKKYFKIAALLVFAALFQSFECDGTPPLGSNNGPYPNNPGIDLSKKTYLEEPVEIPLTLLIEEMIFDERKCHGVDSAAVLFPCCDTIIYSDDSVSLFL